MASYEREPGSVTLDIDDTCEVAHGQRQLLLFNAHDDERCFLPIHIYDTEKSRPDAIRTKRGIDDKAVVRDYAAMPHKAKSWRCERCAVARIEGTRLGLDIGFVVTNLDRGSAE